MKKKKIIALAVVAVIIVIIVAVVVAVGYMSSGINDEGKQQFPAALNVELAYQAGFSENAIREAPYFYYDTKITHEKEWYQPDIYYGADDGCVMLPAQGETTRAVTRANDTERYKNTENALYQHASLFIKNLQDRVYYINGQSGGSVVTEYDDEGSYTEDMTYSIKSQLFDEMVATDDPINPYQLVASENITIGDDTYPLMIDVEFEWWVWSEGSGDGWRAFFTTIMATFVANYNADIIIVIIAHGANPVDAFENSEAAFDSAVYQQLNTTGTYTGAPVHTKGKYDTFSGTRCSLKMDKISSSVGTGDDNIMKWFQKDTQDTNGQDSDPGTYGYFIGYSHVNRYTYSYAYGRGYRGDFDLDVK